MTLKKWKEKQEADKLGLLDSRRVLCLTYPRLAAEEACNLEMPTGTEKESATKPALSNQNARRGAAQQDTRLLEHHCTTLA